MTATVDRSASRTPLTSKPVAPMKARSQRLPVALVAVLIALVSALGFALWARNIGSREPVLALARDVPAGARIEAADLVTTRVAADSGIRAVGADSLDDVVGRIATASLPAGSLLHPEHVADTAPLDPGESIVGVTIDAGEGPALRLESGTQVMVVWTPGSTSATDAPRVIVPSARIESVGGPTARGASIADGDAQYVALRVPTAIAPGVAAAAASDQLRLVLVGVG